MTCAYVWPTPRVSRNYGYFCGADSVARRLVAVSTAVVRCGARYRMLCFTRDVVLRRGFTCAAGSSLAHTAPIALLAPAQTVLPVWKNSVLPVLCCAVVSDAASLGVGRCYVLSGAW